MLNKNRYDEQSMNFPYVKDRYRIRVYLFFPLRSIIKACSFIVWHVDIILGLNGRLYPKQLTNMSLHRVTIQILLRFLFKAQEP